ncbi:MAG: glycosyltransferase family 4 protein [Patescibacteria group bacterium]
MRILFLTNDLDVTNGWGRYSAGFLEQARVRNGASAIVAPDPKSLRSRLPSWHQPLSTLADAMALIKEARRADVIHAAVEPLAPLACLLSLLARVPYVASVHGTYGDLRAYRPAIRWMYHLAFRRASRVLAVSGYTAEVVRRRFPRARIVIVPGGFAAAGRRARGGGMSVERRILSVGAMKPRKGFHTFIEALGLLKAHGLAFRADCLGSKGTSAYVERLESRVKDLGLEDRVRFAGRVSEDELEDAYAAADLFVLPSEHDGPAFEGLGLVYLEAMSRGVPAIGCLESGATDVIKDGENGLLVPPGDSEKLAVAIRRVLSDEAFWKMMSDAAPKSIDRFRWGTVGAEMDAAYKDAISEYAR